MLKFQGDLHWNFAELEDLADSGVEEDRPLVVPVFEGSDQILKLLQKIPFQPFSADAAENVVNSTPTRDHVLAAKKALVIENDGGLVDLIPCTYIR